MAKIGKGTMLSFSGGEYSDKWTHGPFEVLVEFDQKAVADEYVSKFVPQDEWDKPSDDGFVSFLTRSGFIHHVENSYNWYIGSYGYFDPCIADDKES